MQVSILPRKPTKARCIESVPETDTGGQVEYTKALGWAVVKELGKLVL